MTRKLSLLRLQHPVECESGKVHRSATSGRSERVTSLVHTHMLLIHDVDHILRMELKWHQNGREG